MIALAGDSSKAEKNAPPLYRILTGHQFDVIESIGELALNISS
jgi:hypothetical protein